MANYQNQKKRPWDMKQQFPLRDVMMIYGLINKAMLGVFFKNQRSSSVL